MKRYRFYKFEWFGKLDRFNGGLCIGIRFSYCYWSPRGNNYTSFYIFKLSILNFVFVWWFEEMLNEFRLMDDWNTSIFFRR